MNFYKVIVTLFIIVNMSSANAARLKNAENRFARVEVAGKDLISKIENIKSYLGEINKPGSFLKKSFWGRELAWYSDALELTTNDLEIEKKAKNAKLRHLRRTIRQSVLKDQGTQNTSYKNYQNWSVPLTFNFSELYKDSHRLSPALYKHDAERELIQYFKGRGIKQENLSEAVSYYSIHLEKIVNLLDDLILRDIDDLYSNVFYKKYINEEGNPIATESMMKALTRGRSKHYEDFILRGVRGNASIRVDLSSPITEFSIVAKSDTELYSMKADFISTLDEYVAKGLCVKEKGNSGYLVYRDATATGKYKGELIYNVEKNEGFWVPHTYFSKNDLENIITEYTNSERKFVNYSIEYLNAVAEETVRNFSSTIIQDNATDEF